MTCVQSWTPDFIVVGAGNSGSVIAAGLAANPHTKVLLISQGFEVDYRPDTPAFAPWWTTSGTNPAYVADNPTNIPILSNEVSGFAANARQYGPQCPIPGGCSGTNGAVWDANGDNYWDAIAAQTGDARWSGDNVRRLSKWISTYSGSGNVSCHGNHGGINISSPIPEPTALAIERAISGILGIPLLADTICTKSNVGVGHQVRNIDVQTTGTGTKYVRQNTYFELVKPLLAGNPNLRVELGATALYLVPKKNDPSKIKCLVYVDSTGETKKECPDNEIILTMGSVGTASFLMRNGIGDCTHLATLGIDCLLDNVNVGKHVKNQIAFTVLYTGPEEARVPMAGTIAHYISPAAAARSEILPDLMLGSQQIFAFPGVSYILAIIEMCRLQDEGSITLLSADFNTHPLISYNIGLNHPEDLDTLAENFLNFRRIVANVTAQGYPLTEVSAATIPLTTKAAIVNALKTTPLASSNWHYVGSAKMGQAGDTTSVTDSAGHIWGLTGVRVADNSLTGLSHAAHASASSASFVGAVVLDMIISEFGL